MTYLIAGILLALVGILLMVYHKLTKELDIEAKLRIELMCQNVEMLGYALSTREDVVCIIDNMQIARRKNGKIQI